MTNTPDPGGLAVYQPPAIRELGTLRELTLGVVEVPNPDGGAISL